VEADGFAATPPPSMPAASMPFSVVATAGLAVLEPPAQAPPAASASPASEIEPVPVPPPLPGRAGRIERLGRRVRSHLRTAQHRNAYYLILNNAAAAVTGLVFWLLLARVLQVPAADIGVGYATVAIGTTVGVVAKGGLDTALLRMAPRLGRRGADGLLAFASGVGSGVALALLAALAALASAGLLPALGASAWPLAAAIAVLLVVTWLQDAAFLAEGDARFGFGRNLAGSAVRIALPVPLILLAAPSAVATAWAGALAASAALGFFLVKRLPARAGPAPDKREFLRSAGRNVASSAAEFLPGLVLTPLVLAVQGPEAAGYFAMAWTVASLLFLAAAAIGRSALAEMVRHRNSAGDAVGRGLLQMGMLVAPAALIVLALAPEILGVFGAAYASEGAVALAILALSTVAVAPFSLYLAVLRAREATLPLALLPLALVATLLVAAPLMESAWGLPGVACAWLLANLPLGAYAAWRLRRDLGVMPHAPPFGGRPHAE
jgi:O-antigen/teichoic acid export membrane protein